MSRIQRRSFIRKMAAISSLSILAPRIVFGTQANSAVRVGIIGAGNRGTAVLTSMSEHTNTAIVAMADLFDYQLQRAGTTFNELNAKKNIPAIKASNIYQGSKAYLKLLENKEIDAVLISSPAYTHPEFMESAVAAGKHVYCEKPVAPDVAGCKRVEKIGETLNGKVSLVIGFQIRYASAYAQMVKHIQEGAIGNLISAQLYYFSSGAQVHKRGNGSDDEFRIANHFHFNALSGGILLDQGIHMIDICNWALKGHAIEAIGTGGDKDGPGFGDTWNHFEVIYKYNNDVNVSFASTQIGPEFGDVCCRFLGSKGQAEAHYSGGVYINGENKWDSGVARGNQALTPQQQAAGVFLSSLHDADSNKEKAFIDSIVSGKYLNEAKSGAESTLTAVLGREAALAGKKMTWNEVLASNSKLDPKLNLSQFDKKS